MLMNPQNVELAFKGFKKLYTDAYTDAPAHSTKVAMTVPSSAREETYGWLGQMPQLREWLAGSRIVKDLQAHSFTLVNRKFESTVSIKRDDFEDDRLGIFKPMFAEMGHLAKRHPDELVFSLLKSGFAELCYDGQPFFDEDHPRVDQDGNVVETVSNVGVLADGEVEGPAWFLLDTSRAIKPIVWQERSRYDFEQVNRPNGAHTFMTDEHLYGVRARVNAGFGLWHMAYASKQPLTADNYAAARAAMMMFKGDQGGVLGINPTTLVVPPTLEKHALHVVNTETSDGGGSNPWKSTAGLIVTPYVAD